MELIYIRELIEYPEIDFVIVSDNMEKSLVYIERIDKIMPLPESVKAIDLEKLKREMENVNEYSICGKHELKWEVKKITQIFSR